MDALNRVVLNKADTIYQFYTIKPNGKTPQATDGNYYYWYHSDTILITRNGFDGKLLHGEYKVFYPNKNIKESGAFMHGLKTSEWKAWFSNGELESVSHWKAGRKTGQLQEFTPDGQKLRTSEYKNDKLSGYMISYAGDTVVNKTLYRDGQRVQEAIVSKKTKKRSSHAVQK